MDLCTVKLEGPLGRWSRSEQTEEKRAWEVRTHSLGRQVPGKRKAERGKKIKTTPDTPRSHTFSWVRHIIKCCGTK